MWQRHGFDKCDKNDDKNTDSTSTSIPEYCKMFFLSPTDHGTLGTYMVGFTLMYFLVPMAMTNSENWVLLSLLCGIFIGDIYYKIKHKCINMIDLGLNAMFGLGFGGIVGASMMSSKHARNYMFVPKKTSGGSNTCSAEGGKYKCSVTQGGEVVGHVR